MPVISGISDLGGHFLLGLIVGDLSPDIVLVELILCQYIVAHTLVKTIDLKLLRLQVFIFSLVNFEALLQLQL